MVKYFQGYTAHYVKVAVELTENDTKLEQNEVIVVDIQDLLMKIYCTEKFRLNFNVTHSKIFIDCKSARRR